MIWLGLIGCTGGLSETLFLRTDGADLRIRVEGPSDPQAMILLLHGGPGGNSEEYNVGSWSEQVEAEVAVAYLDQRGQGASQGVYDEEDVTFAQLTEDVDVVLAFLGAHYSGVPLFLMGHSWGGALGISALLETDASARVDGWIEVDGAHDVPMLNQLAVPMLISVGGEERDAGRNVERWDEIISFAEGVDLGLITPENSSLINRYAFEAEALIGGLAVDESVGVAELLGYYLTSSVGWPVEAWLGDHTADLLAGEVEQVSYTSRLWELTVPSLLIWGGYDFVVPTPLGEDAVERIDAAELVVLPRSGHSPMFNEPDAFSAAVLDFVAEQRSR
ncbi:MAG: pimeloyl-ACP methyl ester carboxylesterase [Myxococcota bacterium]